MRPYKKSRMRDKLNNQGFTLVELIISIAILVIILVPLMGNFIRSIQMNSKAKRLQIQSNLASSIMEGLKSYNNIDEIIDKFNGSRDDFDLITGPVADVMRLEEDGTGGYMESSSSVHQTSYYFAINGISEGKLVYDAFITMKADPYRIGESENGIMNNYPMPNIINLDEKANGLLFAESDAGSGMTDEDVLNTFITWGRNYAQNVLDNSSEYHNYRIDIADYRSREVEGKLEPGEIPPVEPTLDNLPSSLSYLSTYFTPGEVTRLITKTMTIVSNNDIIDYDIEYICNWPPESGIKRTITHGVSDVRYPISISNIYLFYKPSVFSLSRSILEEPADMIILNNEAEGTLNFYVALQEDESGYRWDNWYNETEISAYGYGSVMLYTDIPAAHYNTGGTIGTANPNVITSKATDRIFDVTIDICEYVNDSDPNNRYKIKVYTLQSAAEY